MDGLGEPSQSDWLNCGREVVGVERLPSCVAGPRLAKRFAKASAAELWTGLGVIANKLELDREGGKLEVVILGISFSGMALGFGVRDLPLLRSPALFIFLSSCGPPVLWSSGEPEAET